MPSRQIFDKESVEQLLKEKRSILAETAERFTSIFAEDCVQEASCKAVDKIDAFKGNSIEQLVAWVRRIVVRECLSKLRQKSNKNKERLSRMDLEADGEHSPSRHLRLDEELKTLKDALQDLTDAEREAIEYRYLIGLKIADTAVLMDKTPIAVGGLIKRGLAKLRFNLEESRFSVLLK